VTNCLNFGNPYKPEVYWVFKEAVGGMGDACRIFDTPVTGGNVSFYNENPEGAVFPTPTIGMLGVVDDVDRHTTTSGFAEEGDAVVMISPSDWIHRNDIGGSEYLARIHGMTAGDAPHLDLDEEARVQRVCMAAIRSGLVRAAHDVSDGGLLVALAEMTIFSGLGADIAVQTDCRLDATLFGEAQSRILLGVRRGDLPALGRIAESEGVQVTDLGTVTSGGLRVTGGQRMLVDLSVDELAKPYTTSIPAYMS
jgi:phosphoribosylformylglycinamidine synthase